MNREPIALYIFRFVLGLGLFAFMAMLYWSSVLLENDMLALRSEVSQLRIQLSTFCTDLQRLRGELLQAVIQEGRPPPAATAPSTTSGVVDSSSSSSKATVGDDKYPNLLQTDSFYTTVLPKLLGTDFKPHGTLHGDTIGKPDNLHPLAGWRDPIAWNQMCHVSVAQNKFGFYEVLAPDMALKMEERRNPTTGNPEFWIFLRRDVYWQPLQQRFFGSSLALAPIFLEKHLVTAHDFKFYYDAVMNPYVQELGAVALRTYLNDIDSLEVVDDYTFIVRWKVHDVDQPDGTKKPMIQYIAKQWTGALQPLASFVFQYFADGTKILQDDTAPDSYRTSSIWAQNFSQHWAKNVIVSCGAWLFDGMTDQEIRFRRNGDYYAPLAVLVDASVTTFRPSADAIWQNFQAGNSDTYTLQPDKLAEWESFQHSSLYQEQKDKGLAIDRIDYLSRSYWYVAWNQSNVLFKSKKVRQALTMAIDRQRLIDQTLNGMAEPINGTFFRNSDAYDGSIPLWPYDPQRARRLLEEEGWFDTTGTGILDKEIDGKTVPFRFSLTYYVKNSQTKSLADAIAMMLQRVGIGCDLHGVDVADLTRELEDRSFEALIMAWSLGTPPDDPRQLWHSSGAHEKGSSNIVGFINSEADKIIDRLSYEYNNEKRVELYHRFDAIIHDEQPYTFLFTPKVALLYRDYLQNVFIPAKRPDLIPGAKVSEPVSSIFWIKKPS